MRRKKAKTRENKSQTYKMFANYGHDCTLDDISDSYESDFAPGNSLFAKFKRWLIKMVVVSETSKFYTHHLRSFGAISKERRRQLKKHPFTIHPFSQGRIIWGLIMIVVILYELIIQPFHFVLFNFKRTIIDFGMVWQSVKVFFHSFLMLNVFINGITGYYDEPMQKVVLNLKYIFIHYLKHSFIIDFLAAIPTTWDVFFDLSPETTNIFLWIAMFKFLLVVTMAKYSKIVADYYNIDHYNYMTTMVVLYTLLFWHMMCCCIIFIKMNIRKFMPHKGTKLFDIHETHAVTALDMFTNETRFWVIYFNALHHNSLLLYNAGYGKELPQDEWEIVVIYSVWYGSSLFFIYILAMIMEINTGRTSSAHKYDEMERQLKEYMRHKQLPTYMRQRILTYYEFKFQKRYFRENEILATISEQLRQEMNMHACRKLVENVIFFRNLPLNLLVRIISCLRIEVFLINDVIIRANTPGASMYFISTGTVAIYTKSGKEVCHLEDGAHFGEIALLIKDTFRIASVIAVEVSEIYRLDQKDFVKAINPYPDLLANIQHIAEERMEVSSMLDEYNRREMATRRIM